MLANEAGAGIPTINTAHQSVHAFTKIPILVAGAGRGIALPDWVGNGHVTPRPF